MTPEPLHRRGFIVPNQPAGVLLSKVAGPGAGGDYALLEIFGVADGLDGSAGLFASAGQGWNRHWPSRGCGGSGVCRTSGLRVWLLRLLSLRLRSLRLLRAELLR